MTAPAHPGRAVPLETTVLVVDGLRCAGCISKLEHGLAAVPGIAAARVNFTTRRVRVDHLAEVSEAEILSSIAGLGFSAHVFAGEGQDASKRESRTLVLAMAVAGFAAMNVMLLSVSIWSGADGATRTLFHWLSALIALPAVAYSGRPFFTSAWAALRKGRTNMDVPISIGVGLTLAMSLYETAIGGPHAYFDGVVMLLFFLLCGRFLDSVMRARAEDGVSALLGRIPLDAAIIGRDGTVTRRAIDEIAPAMHLLVAAGEYIAADGIVLEGTSEIDRSLVTGESLPEPASLGSTVLAGTINLLAPLTIRVTKAGRDTAIADIARLMESAGQAKSRYVRIAERASRLYAPAVHSLAALTFAGWFLAGAGVHQAAITAIAVLIITCPCALGLAVPIAQVVVAGALMRRGVLVKDGSALELLAKADTVLLDKTGTITLGRPVVAGGLPETPWERAALLAVARASRHPVARAIEHALSSVEAAEASNLQEIPGLGIAARIDGVEARLGRPDWIGAPEANGETCFRLGDYPVRLLTIQDEPRPDAAEAIRRLKQENLACEMLSGDAAPIVSALANRLDTAGSARMTPDSKRAVVSELEANGKHVLMVGDGLNDGPALKVASVSMAPATATDVGRLTADLLFLGDRLMSVPIAIAAARRTMHVIRQNFALAVGYNLLAVPLAIAGRVTPLVAALAMSVSSLLVVGNALRLRSAAR
jgi:Cu2+-exporting ATPase